MAERRGVEEDVRALAICLSLLSVGTASAGVRVSLVARPSGLQVGQAWTARLTVRPASYAGGLRVIASGPRRLAFAVHGGHGSYRARIVFPRAGRWTLTAHAGAATSSLGTVTVRAATAPPLLFTWPTAVDVEADGSLLVVENGAGRIVRVQPASKRVTAVVSGLAKPYSVAHGADGRVFLSNDRLLQLVVPGSAPKTVATAAEQIGPIAVAADGTVFFTTASQLFAVSGGTAHAIAGGMSNPHGIAVAADGSVLVSDTGHGRVVRVTPQTGAARTLLRTAQPRGVAVASDGTLVVVDGTTKRVTRYTATGARDGFVGPVFGDPYAVAVARDGTVYVVDTAASGTVARIAPNGAVATL